MANSAEASGSGSTPFAEAGYIQVQQQDKGWQIGWALPDSTWSDVFADLEPCRLILIRPHHKRWLSVVAPLLDILDVPEVNVF